MNILFDLDGTLTDPKEGILNCIRYALEELGYTSPAESELRQYIGPPLQTSFHELLASEDTALVDQAIALYRERFAPTGLFENTLYPDIPETLQHLYSKETTLYVATSKPTIYAEKIISHFGLAKFFREIHGSQLDGTRSNKKELIEYILTKEGLAANETIMVGDRKHDAIGAIANGVQAHGVLWGYGAQEELEQAGCSALHEHPQSLQGLVNA